MSTVVKVSAPFQHCYSRISRTYLITPPFWHLLMGITFSHTKIEDIFSGKSNQNEQYFRSRTSDSICYFHIKFMKRIHCVNCSIICCQGYEQQNRIRHNTANYILLSSMIKEQSMQFISEKHIPE